jgi:Glycosyl hydrolases family 16
MENVGFDPYVIVASAHTSSYNHVQGTQKNNKMTINDCYTKFHVYALEWESNEFRVYVDSTLYFTFKNEGTGYKAWPFDIRVASRKVSPLNLFLPASINSLLHLK